MLQQAALEEVLEELYTEQDPDFLKLVELLATGRDDASIEENILRLHTYSRAYPSPEHWLQNALSLYDEPSRAYRILKESLQELLDSWVLKWENAIRQLEAERTPPEVSFDGTIECIRGYIAELDTLNKLLDAEDWNGFLTAVQNISIPGLKKPKDPENKRKNYSSPALALASKLKEDFTPAKLPGAFQKFALSDEADVAVDQIVELDIVVDVYRVVELPVGVGFAVPDVVFYLDVVARRQVDFILYHRYHLLQGNIVPFFNR